MTFDKIENSYLGIHNFTLRQCIWIKYSQISNINEYNRAKIQIEECLMDLFNLTVLRYKLNVNTTVVFIVVIK